MVKDEQGIHARSAGLIKIAKDGKRIMGVMRLGVKADGEEEANAIDDRAGDKGEFIGRFVDN